IGRTFEESSLKAIRSLEIDRVGLEPNQWSEDDLIRELREPTDARLFAIAEAVRRDLPTEKIASLTAWDPFFIEKIRRLVRMESALRESPKDATRVSDTKRLRFADESIAALTGRSELAVRRAPPRGVYKMVDTCGGEFEAETAYLYSSYEPGGEPRKLAGRKVLVGGGRPSRTGHGVGV